MKKLNITILSSILLTTSLLTIKSNAQDNTYQTYTKPIPKTYNLQELPKEVQEDIQSIQNMKYLKLKTPSNYEIAISNDDGTYSYVQSEDNLNSAIDIANNLKNTKNQGIPVVINKEGIIIYATEGIGRIVKIIDGNVDTTNNYTTSVYKTSGLNSPEHTYINHGYIDDVPIIEDNGQVVKIEVSGYTGYIKKQEDDGSLNIITVPMNQVNNLSHYTVNTNNELVHAISSDITSTPKYSYQTLGPAPSFMNQNTKYYSYDGNYFYTDINQLILDAKLDNHNNAINSNNPYYNYYQYLPGRSKTSYTADDINRYFEQYTPSDSLLRNTGSYFIKAQNEYGTNAALLVGIAMNESDRGTSNLAKTKFNVFGANAKDGYVEGADKFSSIEECIIRVSNYSFSNGYFNPKSWKYNSSSLGNKSLGANVRYASDPFWSEKAINRIYQFDKFLGGDTGLKDYNRYLLGMYTNATSLKNTSNKELYSILPQNTRTKNTCKGQVGDTTIILNEKDSNNYNIRPDRIVPITETNINGDGTYLWDREGIVNKTNIKIINEKSNPNTDFTNHWAKSYIIDGMNKGWVYTTNAFNPENFITRAEFIKIVNRAFNITQIGQENFSDVNPGDWFYNEVRIATNAGYINGRGDGIFAPYDPITRQEAAKIIGYITNKIEYNFTYLSAFNDGNLVLDWAKPYVEGVLKAGYMNGYAEDNTFKPTSNIKRAEAVTILSRAKN
nr:S-layer homology domain-containing protein [uncultured Romboutsia sp.]